MTNGKLLTEFAERFESLLKERGWHRLTDKELALKFGKSNTAIWNWRNAVKLPSLATAINLAIHFDVCVDWLLTGRGNKHPSQTNGNGNGNTLDISMLPHGQQVHLKALVHEIQEQVAGYKGPVKE